jgi:divalent metal cation (Fe/Co/Zn/Cd) transporter
MRVQDEKLRAVSIRKGRILSYMTIGWNLIEGAVAIASGLFSGSTALVGFGFDSLIESTSGTALLWRLYKDAPEKRENSEQVALRLVGFSFILLALYIAVDASYSLLYHEAPDSSYIGIILGILSLIIMPLLARAKRDVASQIDSRALRADSRQTDICAYLSAILLIGLGLNALLGWWWADPVAALIMLPIILKEARDALAGKACDDCH